MKYLLIVLGGGAGSLTRYLVGTAIVTRFGTRFPMVGTMTINITGSFLIGLLMTLITERFGANVNLRALLVLGFLGGYTTFSSFEWETLAVIRNGGLWLGMFNMVGSVAFGYAAVWLGAVVARR
ncbi:MAG TPA: fluoride efflux transporter CrcB [Bryobacteraceae bacterium]|jgi:CrcB protein|nr:fluoride efflux transporter CrcB [Bryobacteraceae bacterium]